MHTHWHTAWCEWASQTRSKVLSFNHHFKAIPVSHILWFIFAPAFPLRSLIGSCERSIILSMMSGTSASDSDQILPNLCSFSDPEVCSNSTKNYDVDSTSALAQWSVSFKILKVIPPLEPLSLGQCAECGRKNKRRWPLIYCPSSFLSPVDKIILHVYQKAPTSHHMLWINPRNLILRKDNLQLLQMK